MKTFLIVFFASAIIGILVKAYLFILSSRRQRLPLEERSPMRTYIRVLIAVSMVAILTGMGLVLGIVYGIFIWLRLKAGSAPAATPSMQLWTVRL
ncbi:MAG: hypothetical protein EXR85_05730 [Xanthomonadales bacterium]|nr:hypothetical protein [Xanthomonadales bacterium]